MVIYIYIYKDKTDKHNLTQVATEWLALREPRQFNFGKLLTAVTSRFATLTTANTKIT